MELVLGHEYPPLSTSTYSQMCHNPGVHLIQAIGLKENLLAATRVFWLAYTSGLTPCLSAILLSKKLN